MTHHSVYPYRPIPIAIRILDGRLPRPLGDHEQMHRSGRRNQEGPRHIRRRSVRESHHLDKGHNSARTNFSLSVFLIDLYISRSLGRLAESLQVLLRTVIQQTGDIGGMASEPARPLPEQQPFRLAPCSTQPATLPQGRRPDDESQSRHPAGMHLRNTESPGRRSDVLWDYIGSATLPGSIPL